MKYFNYPYKYQMMKRKTKIQVKHLNKIDKSNYLVDKTLIFLFGVLYFVLFILFF